MADQDDKPILDLNTLIKRPKVGIDGVLYEILSPDELSVVDSQRFALWGTRVSDLASDETKGLDLEELVDDLARKIAVGVPESLMNKLSGVKKYQLIEVFTLLLLASKAKLVGAAAAMLEGLEKETSATGAKLSHGSKGSTGAARNGGTSKRRSAS